MGSHREAAARALQFNEVTDTAVEAQLNEQTLRDNDYPQDRGIFQRGAADNLNHIDFFGDCYLHALHELCENDVWLHVGPGDFYAEVDYFTSPLFEKHAKVVSNAYCLSNSPESVTNLKLLGQFRRNGKLDIIDGIKFQDLRGSFPQKVKLISDVFAAGSYDEDLFGFFRVASELLLPGGILAVVLATVSFDSANGESISASDVYRSMKGFELINSTENNGWVFRRTNETFIGQKAEMISFVARNRAKGIMWPIRRYKIYDLD